MKPKEEEERRRERSSGEATDSTSCEREKRRAGQRWEGGARRKDHREPQRTGSWQRRAHSFVGLLLAGVLRCFAGVAADLHVHGVDDVEEVLHHRHTLQGRVHRRNAVRTLQGHRDRFSVHSHFLTFDLKLHRREETRAEADARITPPSAL